MRRWYQNIDIDGLKVVFEGEDRKGSKFWNEGKWDNFIKPLLPKDKRTFIEIGCNAGLFLKMATDVGFQDVIGVEGHPKMMEQANLFKESNKYNYKLIQQRVGENFELDKLPLADVILLSNVHYYFPIHVFAELVDRLKSRAVYCIVVGAIARRREGNAVHCLGAPNGDDGHGVRGYFKDWKELKMIDGLSGERARREQMYGVLFKGNLDVIDIDTFYDGWFEKSIKFTKHKGFALAPALKEFFRKVLNKEKFNFKETLYYQFLKNREPNQGDKWIQETLTYKKSLAEDIQVNGIKEPIYFDQRGKLLDGIHRLCIVKELGYKHIIIRKI